MIFSFLICIIYLLFFQREFFSELLIVHFHSSSMSICHQECFNVYIEMHFCFIIINSAVQIEGFESFDLLIFYLNSQIGSMFIYLFKFSFGLLSISPHPREYVSVIIF